MSFVDKIEWELIARHSMPNSEDLTERLPVPGGWLVRCTIGLETSENLATSCTITFLPDPGHTWLKELK